MAPTLAGEETERRMQEGRLYLSQKQENCPCLHALPTDFLQSLEGTSCFSHNTFRASRSELVIYGEEMMQKVSSRSVSNFT